MDRMRDFADDDHRSETNEPVEYGVETAMLANQDERRMHVRAYNHWVSLLHGKMYPSIEDLEPEANTDFGPHSVLLDFTSSAEHPSIVYLGEKLREECGLSDSIETVLDVPPRSLISRLTDHHMQILANRAPVGFEAEFENTRGNTTMYRGILMPYSSDDDTIDFIHGVINWKEVVSDAEQEGLQAELAAAPPPAPVHAPLPAWADGPASIDSLNDNPVQLAPATADQGDPSTDDVLDLVDHADVASIEELDLPTPTLDADAGLADWLANARSSADAVRHADSRSRSALYQALGHAYDFALIAGMRPDEYQELLDDTGLKAQERAPMTPIVKLVFGVDYDKTRLTEFAAALSYAKRHGLPSGGMRHFLDQYPGGLKAVVAAERRERRPEGVVTRVDAVRDAARALPEQVELALPGDDEFVVLVARRVDGERVAIIGVVPDDKVMTDKALRAIID